MPRKREKHLEWSKKSQYNSFNSFKGLTYYKNYKQIIKWLDGDPYLPPPVEVNLDPVKGCNLNCYFCITQSYMKGVKRKLLPLDYMLRLVDFLKDWGVRGLCISGGGGAIVEPRYTYRDSTCETRVVNGRCFCNY